MEEIKRHLWGLWHFVWEHPIATGLALGTSICAIIEAITR